MEEGTKKEGTLAHEERMRVWAEHKKRPGNWNPLKGVSLEISKILGQEENRALVLEAIFCGTFDSVTNHVDIEYELMGRGYSKEEAAILAPWIEEKRKDFLGSIGAADDTTAGK